MKKILIYTTNDGHFVDSLYKSIGYGFNELGREVVFVDVNSSNIEENISNIFNNNEIDFSIGHNEFGINLTSRYAWLKKIYQKIEHISILDDAPYNIVTFNIRHIECDKLIIAYRDRSHFGYLKSLDARSSIKTTFFMPFGSLITNDNNAIEKDIDIVFSGMYYGQPYREWNDLGLIDSEKNIINEVADILELYPYTVDKAFNIVLKKYRITDRTIKNYFYKYYTMLYCYIKTYRRDLLIGYLSNTDLKINVCDKSWKESPYSDRLDFVLASTTNDIIEIYKRSKILVQDMAEFNDGSHCRIADGFLCNTMVVSEFSNYIHEYFNSSEILMFKWSELHTLPMIIKRILYNDSLRNSYNSNARKVVKKYFLPRHRAHKILYIIDKFRNIY